MSNFRDRWEEGISKPRLDRFCEICGVDKSVVSHELWCTNEPDRVGFEDDDERCPCSNCTTYMNNLAKAAGNEEWDNPDDEWVDPESDHHEYTEHEAHVDRILDAVNAELRRKYKAGQKEHGGNLWEKPGMLDHAIEEVLDLIVYLYTLREQQEEKYQ